MTDQTLRMQFQGIGDDDMPEEGQPTRLPSADDDDENSGVIPDDLELDEDLEDDGLGSEE